MTNLTTEQCDEFRRHPGSFNDMVRHIYTTAEKRAYERCKKIIADADNRHHEYEDTFFEIETEIDILLGLCQ